MAKGDGWAVDDAGRRGIHVMPINDWREHTYSGKCWCKPVQDEELPRLWVHNAMDKREAYETGERKPS